MAIGRTGRSLRIDDFLTKRLLVKVLLLEVLLDLLLEVLIKTSEFECVFKHALCFRCFGEFSERLQRSPEIWPFNGIEQLTLYQPGLFNLLGSLKLRGVIKVLFLDGPS